MEDIEKIEEINEENENDIVKNDNSMDIVDVDELAPSEAAKSPIVSVRSEEVKTVSKEEGGNAGLDMPKDAVPDLQNVGNRMDTEARWYVLHTFSGYEAVAEDNLKKVIEKYNLSGRVFEVFIPTEETIVEKNDKKVLVPSKTMPSYIFIKMVYGDDLWHTITRTRGITGFVGPRGRPLPLTSREVINMKLERKPNLNVKLEVKDTIQIIDGPLAGQTATVTSVDSANSKCTASVSMFGRPTSVELHLSQIKKIS